MMKPDHATGPSGSASGASEGAGVRKTPKGDAPHVETYQLPRWDAQGRPVQDPKANQPDPGSVEDVNPESLKPPTADEIRQIHEDAYNEGFESGFEQGMKQGQATGQAEGYKAGYDSGEQEGLSAGNKAGMLAAQQAEEERISAELAPLAELLTQIKEVLGQQTDDVKSGLVALATRIARNVIDAELTLNPDHIQTLVHAAVQALPNADERFTLELNPEDEALVKRIAEPHWNLVPTATVSRGGCIIRTRFSYVDYSLEHRYRQQISNLLAHAGLSEQLTAMESPWPLPAAEPEADAGATGDETALVEDSTTEEPAPVDAETPESESQNTAATEAGGTAAEISDADLAQVDAMPTETSDPLAPEADTPEEQQSESDAVAPEHPEPAAHETRQTETDDSAPEATVDSGESASQPETQTPDEAADIPSTENTEAENAGSGEPDEDDKSDPQATPARRGDDE
ncbi:MAG TPA: FliH/SctL family protein [Saccharospirillum sp.]|nr:FliH/SctL family protein [Saccharospirillum sp.]